MSRGIAASVSASTVRRRLDQETIKPWQYRSWIFITGPGFRPEAARVPDLHGRSWDGEPIGADEYVISADEKASIQARCRCHPTLAPGQARAMRVNHAYGRGGAPAYLAAYEVHRQDQPAVGRPGEAAGPPAFAAGGRRPGAPCRARRTGLRARTGVPKRVGPVNPGARGTGQGCRAE